MPVQFFNNEQDFDLFQGVIPGVAGESDLAFLVAAAAIDGDRVGGDPVDHIDRMGHGPGIQFDPALCLFIIRRQLVIA